MHCAVWEKPRLSDGPGGFIRYAAPTCINHLKTCSNQPIDIQQRAQAEATESPKKAPGRPRFSPFGSTWSGATLVPGMFPPNSTSSQMLPPSLPSTRFNSPALTTHSMMPSPAVSVLPSPSLSSQPSPQLSALQFPGINTLPTPHLGQLPAWSDQSLTPTLQPISIDPTASGSQLVQPPNNGPWSPQLQALFEVHIARLTAAASFSLSWVDNPEWIAFVQRFIPGAISPSRKVLSTRLIPRVAEDYRQTAKDFSKGQSATIQADGWTGSNFHHLLAFMITVNKRVGFPFDRLNRF